MTDDRTEAEQVDPNIHVDMDDQRYDGFRIREYWIATTTAGDNQEAALYVDPIRSHQFHLSEGPAMASDERRLVHLREYAKAASEHFGIEVHVRHFVPEGDPEIYGGTE